MSIENLKKQKGISLLSLIITIIILIILAGIGISSLTGENGIIKNSQNAKLQTEIAAGKEKLQLIYTEQFTEEFVQNNGNNIELGDYLNYIEEQGIPTKEEEGKSYAEVDGKIYEILQEGENIKIDYVEEGEITEPRINQIIVVEKTPNIPVQKDSSEDIDMLNLVKNYIKEKYNKPGNVYLGLVHRLDRPVGGVIVFAKTSKAASRLSNEVREKVFKKEYLAVVEGKLEKTKGTLENYLYKDVKKNTSYVVDKNEKQAKFAKLDYEVLKYDEKENVSLLKINLHTGRHHQIRVQLSNIGHSIYGDQRYGKIGKNKQIALWAYKLTILHPIKKEKMEFVSIPKKIGIWKILED